MQVSDILSLSFRTVRSNMLRTVITVSIIALGIMALIGIITMIAAMNQKLTESFSTMGANGFTIRYKARNVRFGGNDNEVTVEKKGAKKEKRSNLDRRITEEEAEEFINNFQFPGASAGISTFGGRDNIASFDGIKTSPNVVMLAGDQNYLILNGFKLDFGRSFNHNDVSSARNVCLLGYDVAKLLFRDQPERAVNQIININNRPYRVLGVLASRGSSFGFSRDNVMIVSYSNARRHFVSNPSYTIGVMVDDIGKVETAMGEAEGLFRGIRKMTTTEESNFVIDRSDAIVERAMKSLGFLTISALVIGLITLVGAAIGLMNIMLVSVTERTKEVGLIKAIGGKNNVVRNQFLMESIIISLLGALIGIFLGVVAGNIFSMILGTSFVVPWKWVFGGVIICSVVGLVAGIYPALRAGRLNPIEALRYE